MYSTQIDQQKDIPQVVPLFLFSLNITYIVKYTCIIVLLLPLPMHMAE